MWFSNLLTTLTLTVTLLQLELNIKKYFIKLILTITSLNTCSQSRTCEKDKENMLHNNKYMSLNICSP